MKRLSSNCNCKLVIGINYQNLLPSKAKLNTKPAPSMAPFSCQGPNTITAEIIEPDLTAPGVDIIVAVHGAVPPTLCCPHVSRPNRAIDPGLVYDLKVNDYLDFHFVIGYNQTRVRAFCEGPSVTCSALLRAALS
ncbi:hypothetical protein J1N35_030883 [Gossypium stocksii]|uniref:Uncharacterized protein n=1 Tax=Gossypium stocksii TaxID=47602 RepID=A0A9D3V0I5_9ROSI|nr:hypothetical protein J1N35_030883 [Gossypium stocksii]